MQTATLTSRPMAVPGALARLVRLPPIQAWTRVLLVLDLTAIGDWATGSAVWFGPAYLVVICLAAWALGWRAGQVTALGCMALTFAINGFELYPYGARAFAGNLALRFAAVSLLVLTIAAVRRAYLREWQLARTDIMTGALNRQAFFELAERTSDRHWRLLVYADLDGLKQVNDHHGHGAGDACLRAYAGAVARAVRRQDLFARVGGDEFLLLLTVRDEAAAQIVAARLHAQMNQVRGHDGSLLRCSVGAVAAPPGPASIDDLVRLADSSMYRAKQDGSGLEFSQFDGSAAGQPGAARAVRRAPIPTTSLHPARRPIRERRHPLGL